MFVTLKDQQRIEVHLSRKELEAVLVAQTISGVDVSITGELPDGKYRTVKASDINITQTFLAFHVLTPMEDPFPSLFR